MRADISVQDATLLAPEEPDAERLAFDADVRWLNHRSFRFPAKFHPAVAKELVRRFSSPNDLVLDPFCGSGTLLIEALAAGRNAMGFDLDPLAVFLSDAKTRRYAIDRLLENFGELTDRLLAARSKHIERDGSFELEISDCQYEQTSEAFAKAPLIPNLLHWFRRRVVLQLLEIKETIGAICQDNDDSLTFFRLCFASIIRNSSNADPVPVSGLEVTAHMRRLEKEGRSIDPFKLMLRAVGRNVAATKAFLEASSDSARVRAFRRDASKPWLENVPKADVVITSPPYLSAVDYYRRHQLEMFWLDLVETHNDRLMLLPAYIGRSSPSRAAYNEDNRRSPSQVERDWSARLRGDSPDRVRALEHYSASMQTALENQSRVLKKNGLLILVVGDSRIIGRPFPTSTLLEQLCSDVFQLSGRYWYPVTNRYMSYSRKNGADIASESVLVLKRR